HPGDRRHATFVDARARPRRQAACQGARNSLRPCHPEANPMTPSRTLHFKLRPVIGAQEHQGHEESVVEHGDDVKACYSLLGPDFHRLDRTSLCWRTHSITSSARASSAGGIATPRAFAVFMLMTNSYLVGACTGRSAGFSPLRMRST